MKRFWLKCIKKYILVTIPTIVAVLTILTIFSHGFENALKKLGIMGAILTCCICLILTLIYEIGCMLKDFEIEDRGCNSNENAINNLFKIASLFIMYSNKNIHINIHYFSYKKNNEEEFLYKERKYGYESDRLSVDYSLEKCRLDARNIVMCKAFKNNCVIFENLSDNHVSTYDSDIKDFIDKSIKWVLACPVWKNHNTLEKIGVVVIFGLNEIANDNEINKINILKNLCLELSKSMAEFL